MLFTPTFAPVVSGAVEGFVAASTDNGDGTITLPSGSAADDLIIIAEYAGATTASWLGDDLVPSGATQFTDGTTPMQVSWTVSTFTFQLQVYWKILTAGDVSTGFITSAYPGNPGMAAHTFRGPAAITAFAEFDCAAERAANPTAQTLNASGGTTPLINVAASVPDADMSISPAADNVTTGTDIYLGTSYYASGTPDDWTVDDNGSGGAEAIMSGYGQIST